MTIPTPSATTSFILATAGHVDHGKSSLIKALTHIDPTRLPEEKARGITIDLGFAEMNLPHPTIPDHQFHVGIIDVPGHEDFVKNMVSGVGAIDVALLVIAADDGWMPQTEEHFQILNYLRVPHLLIALTKTDLLADQDLEWIIETIREELKDSPYPQAPILPVSNVTEQGLETLKQSLATLLTKASPPPDYQKPRLAIDRAFTLRGIGVVVTGTLMGGTLEKNQNVVVHPHHIESKIRSLQSHGRETTIAHPGSRVALNLPHVDLQQPGKSSGIQRGHTVTLPELGNSTLLIEAKIERSPRLNRGQYQVTLPIRHNMPIRIHHGSESYPARLLLMEGSECHAGESALVQIKLTSPAFAFVGDRFVIRDISEQKTLGGGVILDTHPQPKMFRDPRQKHFLSRIATNLNDLPNLIPHFLRRHPLLETETFLKQSHFSTSNISEEIGKSHAGIFLTPKLLLQKELWENWSTNLSKTIDQEHVKRPERWGLSRSNFHQWCDRIPLPIEQRENFLNLFLKITPYRTTHHCLHHQQHTPKMTKELEGEVRRLQRIFDDKPYDPPSRKQLETHPDSAKALRYLIDTEEIQEMTPDILLPKASCEHMTQLIISYLTQHQEATASQLRDHLQTSRRVMIPLLETLDRLNITQRNGDLRTLKHPAPGKEPN